MDWNVKRGEDSRFNQHVSEACAGSLLLEEVVFNDDVVNSIRLILEAGDRLLADGLVLDLPEVVVDQLGRRDLGRLVRLDVEEEGEAAQIFGSVPALYQFFFVESGKFPHMKTETVCHNLFHDLLPIPRQVFGLVTCKDLRLVDLL